MNDPVLPVAGEATFRTTAAIGARVTVRPIEELGTGERLRAAAQAYAHAVAELLAAGNVTVSPVERLPSGGEYAVVRADLPPQPGGERDGSVLRSAFVQMPGRAVNVEYVSRAQDPQAGVQFADLLKTLRAAPPAGLVTEALESLAGPHRTTAAVTFELPKSFGAAGSARFTQAKESLQFEAANAPTGFESAIPVKPGVFFPLASTTRDDGSAVLYELPPAGPGAQELESLAAPKPAPQDVVVDGRRLRVQGTAANTPAAENLVRSAVEEAAKPKQ